MQTKARAAKKDSVKRATIPVEPRTAEKNALIKQNAALVLEALSDPRVERTDAGKALSFKLALPKLDSHASIKAFIGHVAQGIALGIFTGREGSQLLYAAQVALGALHGEPTAPASTTSPELCARSSFNRLKSPANALRNASRRLMRIWCMFRIASLRLIGCHLGVRSQPR